MRDVSLSLSVIVLGPAVGSWEPLFQVIVPPDHTLNTLWQQETSQGILSHLPSGEQQLPRVP